MHITAGEIMTRHVVSTPPHEPVRSVLAAMYERGIRHVPVVDDDGRVVGIVTDRDLREHIGPLTEWFADPEGRADALNDPVEVVMTPEPVTVGPETMLGDVVDLLVEEKFGGLPVVEDDGRLVGFISYVDVLRAVRELFD